MKEEIITIPETRQERIDRLEYTIRTLKSEFIGLDSIIDEIKESISSWYITPEIINRPVVVSLWGMTGTGKSSVVKRLIHLLGLSNVSMMFDCGECTNSDTSIVGNICDTLGIDTDDFTQQPEEPNPFKKQNLVFVFDEFQYARTINESGEEDIKSSLRPIWSLIDSGIVEANDKYSWDFNRLINFMEDFDSFVGVGPNVKIKNNLIENPDEVKLILETIGFLQYDSRQIPGITADRHEVEDEEPYRHLKVLDSDKLRTITRKLNLVKPGFGVEKVKELLNKTCTVTEFNECLKEIKKYLIRPKSLNCSNSLIFVIGNLDEAFTVSKDLNPDIDADMFYDITSKVTISDIKTALITRFRPEQIARLGNNLIKYPTLKKTDLEKIIHKEVNRLLNEFEKVCPIKLVIGHDIFNLLYSEGVFPTQGVRPILTTIGTLFTPYFSKILIENDGSEQAEIYLEDSNFKSDTIDVYIKFSSGKLVRYKQKLQLGEIRNPKSRKKRYIASIHEAGHAIIHAYVTGNAPENIVSVSTDKGGFCTTYDKESEGEIRSKIDVYNEVMTCLGGYLAEKCIFPEDLCLMGSSSDLESAWKELSESAYEVGLIDPKPYASRDTESNQNIPSGFDDRSIEQNIISIYDSLQTRTQDILKKEKPLLIELAKYLGETGSMSSDIFLTIVDKYGNKLTKEHMDRKRKELDPENYFKIINQHGI